MEIQNISCFDLFFVADKIQFLVLISSFLYNLTGLKEICRYNLYEVIFIKKLLHNITKLNKHLLSMKVNWNSSFGGGP